MFVQVNERCEKVENSIQRELSSSSIVNENKPADSGGVIHLNYIFTIGNCIGDRPTAAGCYATHTDYIVEADRSASCNFNTCVSNRKCIWFIFY